MTAAPRAGLAQSAEMTLPSVTKDRGLRSGDFTLHPSFGLQGHHDTNLFNGNDVEVGNQPKGATSLRFLPKLSLQNEATGNVTFLFSAGGDARLYLNEDTAIQEQDGLGGTAGLDLTFGARKSISFSLFDYFGRHLRANNWETSEALDRNSNDVGARVEFHPGEIPERRPFKIALMGSYAIDRFDDFESGDTNMVNTRLTGSWRFLPKTAAIVDASWNFRSYVNDTLARKGLASDSQPFRAKAGLAGALTKRVSFELLGGWGMSLHEAGTEANTYLANVSVGLRPGESTRVLLQYTHDFRDSFYGNFVNYHRGSFGLRQRFGQILDVKANFGASFGTYGTVDQGASNTSPDKVNAAVVPTRTDTALDGSVGASFDISRLVGMDIGYQLRSVITNFKVFASDKKTVLDDGAYTAHELFATLTVRY